MVSYIDIVAEPSTNRLNVNIAYTNVVSDENVKNFVASFYR